MSAAPGIGDRYQVGDVIGLGGTAEVLAGEDLFLHRPVAVKRLLPEFAEEPRSRTRFEVEARTAARLSHPNVVQVFDIGEADGLPFLVMERLSGRTLADVMATGPLGESEALRLADQVLAALAAAHAIGIVHGDIRPANILLAEDGSAKVSDFGTAKPDPLDAVRLAPAGSDVIGGTPPYLAPEHLEGHPPTPASDIWSVGVLLYEALAGAKPFAGGTPPAREGTLEPLSALRQDLSPAIVGAVHRAMASAPADRFATADEMARALGAGRARLLADLTATVPEVSGAPTQQLGPVTARVPTGSPRAARPGIVGLLATRRLVGAGVVGLLVVLLVAGLVMALGRGPVARRAVPDRRAAAALRTAKAGPSVPSTTAPSTTVPSTTPPSTTQPTSGAAAVVVGTPIVASTPPPPPPSTTTTTTTTTTPPGSGSGSPVGGGGSGGGGGPPGGSGGTTGAGPGQ